MCPLEHHSVENLDRVNQGWSDGIIEKKVDSSRLDLTSNHGEFFVVLKEKKICGHGSRHLPSAFNYPLNRNSSHINLRFRLRLRGHDQTTFSQLEPNQSSKQQWPILWCFKMNSTWAPRKSNLLACSSLRKILTPCSWTPREFNTAPSRSRQLINSEESSKRPHTATTKT